MMIQRIVITHDVAERKAVDLFQYFVHLKNTLHALLLLIYLILNVYHKLPVVKHWIEFGNTDIDKIFSHFQGNFRRA